MKLRILLTLVLVGLLVAGCQEKPREAPREVQPRAKEEADKKKADEDNKKADDDKKQKKGDETALVVAQQQEGGWGTVKGTITYDAKAKLPANPEVNVTTDKAFCTAKGKILRDEWVIDPKTRGVKNVIVWLSPENKAAHQNMDWDPKLIHPRLKDVPKKLVVDQPVCSFMPRIIVLREGTDLVFKNSATVTHNVSIEGGKLLGPQLNLTIPPDKSLDVGSVKSRFVPIPYKCTIHPWMKGYLNSFKHPYFAVTNEKGEFELKDAPEGKYRLQVWQENYGFVQKNKDDRGIVITIEKDKTTEVKVPPLIEED